MKLTILTPIAAALTVAACASTVEVAETGEVLSASQVAPYSEWPTEFQGRTVEIVTRDGYTNVVNLAPDVTMTIIPELSTEVIKGSWGSKGDAVCTNFAPRGEECWSPAPVIAANGDFVSVRSDRGQQLKVRLLNESEEEQVDRGG